MKEKILKWLKELFCPECECHVKLASDVFKMKKSKKKSKQRRNK